MIVCQENLDHTAKLQKNTQNTGIKSRIYVANNNIWFDSKYIKTQ